MNILFMNSLCRREENDKDCTARVCVGQDEHGLRIIWTEDRKNQPAVQEDWYEGGEQEELKAVLQYRLAGKMGEGFLPVMEGLLEDAVPARSRASLAQMLVFYAEAHPNKALFDKLRLWRKEKAIEIGRAPYIVATNKLLQLLSVYIPQTKEEMLQIPGFGDYKWGLYGEQLAALLAQEERTHAFPLQWVAAQLDHHALFIWICQQHEQKHRLVWVRHQQRKQLLENVDKKLKLGELETSLSMSRREILLLMEQLEQEGYELAPLIERFAEEIPQQWLADAERAFQEEGTRFLKPVLYRLYAEEELEGQDVQQLYDWLRIVRMHSRKPGIVYNRE